MDFITSLEQRLEASIKAVFAEYEGELGGESLAQMETEIQGLGQRLGNRVLATWLTQQEEKYPPDQRECPHCGGAAWYSRWRTGMVITLQGRVYYRRTYYQCGCGQGHYPLDQKLGIVAGQMSGTVQEVAALLGVHEAFATGQGILKRLTGLDLSANTLRHACGQVGEQILAHEAALVTRSYAESQQLAQRQRSHIPPRLYGSLDGFMAYVEDGWHEMKAGVWWTTTTNPQGILQSHPCHYYTDLATAEAFSPLVWATGFELLADQTPELIFVADGAEWIWRIVQTHYPHAIQIVDWFHATAYLSPIATAAFADPVQAQTWLDHQKNLLWQGHLASVFRACRNLSAAAPEPVRKALGYFARNRTRMRYAKFRAQGLQIGSGTMESACKQLGLQRLKIPGAQWSVEGIRKLAKARAAYLSNQWANLNFSRQRLPQVA
jgi:hypothetical protein